MHYLSVPPEQVAAFYAATLHHMHEVQQNINLAIANLLDRSSVHDRSKLDPPECDGFAELMHEVAFYPYGSVEHQALIQRYRHIFAHHYAMNDHHPQHTSEGFAGMSLLSLLEMLCDWESAIRRGNAGTRPAGAILESLARAQQHHGMDDALYQILRRTAIELGFDTASAPTVKGPDGDS